MIYAMSLLLGEKELFPLVIHSYVHISPVKKVSNKARWELGKSALMMTRLVLSGFWIKWPALIS